MSRLRAELLDGFPGLVRAGLALPVFPTVDSGYKFYGPGRLMLPAGTNYCTRPRLFAGAANVLSTGWTEDTSVSGARTWSKLSGVDGLANSGQRVRYTSDGDSTKKVAFMINSPAGAWAGPDPVTISGYFKCASTGCTPKLFVYDGTSWAILATVTITNCTEWTRFSASGLGGAATTFLKIYVGAADIDTGDVLDVAVDQILIEKSAVLNPYFDGTYPDCSWSGAANASTSTRAVSLLSCAGSWLPQSEGTYALRVVPLVAHTGLPANSYLLTPNGSGTYATVYWNGSGWRCRKAGAFPTVAATFTPGQSQTIVARFSATTVDVTVNGTAAAQGSDETTAAVTSMSIGVQVGGYNPSYCYIGPGAISPYDIGASNAAYLDAGLTAGWGGMELFRFFRDRGYTNTLILPLNGDSVGYTVV